MKSGPIIIVEDDVDDKVNMEEIFGELNIKNKIVWFSRTEEAFHYLKTTKEQPFIIFSDINLPGENGLNFKRRIDEDEELRRKSIPFIFYSTSTNQKEVNEAYMQLTIQGFFQKHTGYEKMKSELKLIYEYWQVCKHPNSV